MKRFMIALVAAAAVLALAACGGDGYGNGDPAPAAQSGDDSATVTVKELGDAGRVLVDAAGKPLYAAEEEAESGVVCTGACTSFWIPLTTDGAPSGTSVPGELDVTERADGTRQVTFDGKRLYTFVQDEPGEVTGDGLSDEFDGQQFTWHVVQVAEADSEQKGGDTGGSFGY